VDAGSVYANNQNINLDELRYSTGVGVSWFSPFGPLKLVFAKALNEEDGDKTETLQFQLGSQF
jgi:outer membrane protein insertion porin family